MSDLKADLVSLGIGYSASTEMTCMGRVGIIRVTVLGIDLEAQTVDLTIEREITDEFKLSGDDD